MPSLVYQCPSGISGDMNLSAMIGLGVDPRFLETELRKLPYKDWSIHFSEDIRQGIQGIRCDVKLKHRHEHIHGHHAHSHGHHHSDDHHHRTFRDIHDAIEQSSLSDRVKSDAIRCFRVLAEAEGAVHGIEPEEVHFHEVGAIDSIVDMVGAAICWDILGIDSIYCSTLEVGGGTVHCAHGVMPVPAPATARLLQGVPYSSGGTNKETTTPTGAALLVGKSCQFNASISGTQKATSIGIGQRDDPNLPNAVYVTLIEESPANSSESIYEQDTVWELVVNLDDMTAESISFLSSLLMDKGALDVWQTPATFKKGRLGTVLHLLCPIKQRNILERLMLQHSTSLGVRRNQWQRTKLKREMSILETEWGTIRSKTVQLPDGSTSMKIEHDDLARIASETDQSIRSVEEQLRAILKKQS